MAIDIRQDKLLKKVVKDNEFFKSIFNLIPPTFYFDSETKELLAEDFANEIAQHTTGISLTNLNIISILTFH